MLPSVSKRVLQTSTAVIDDLLEVHGTTPQLFNLAPGAPAISPSAAVQQAAAAAAADPAVSAYGDVLGYTPLRECWLGRILSQLPRGEQPENAVPAAGPRVTASDVELMITAGANQGFFSVILTVCDPGDEVVLLAPYYFSHLNALTSCDVTPVVVPCDPTTLLPRSIGSIEAVVTPRTRAVVLVSPGNPSGVIAPRELVDALSALCEARGLWLISDEAYAHITYGLGDDVDSRSGAHAPRSSPCVIRLHTMSKVYGLAGWRVGALVYPRRLSVHLRKVQDTIPTHTAVASQVAALAALEHDSALIPARVQTLGAVRACFLQRLDAVYAQLPDLHLVPGAGAFYLFLPVAGGISDSDDDAVAFLAHPPTRVLTVPGTAFGMSGYVRVSFGSVSLGQADAAATALADGLLRWFALMP